MFMKDIHILNFLFALYNFLHLFIVYNTLLATNYKFNSCESIVTWRSGKILLLIKM